MERMIAALVCNVIKPPDPRVQLPSLEVQATDSEVFVRLSPLDARRMHEAVRSLSIGESVTLRGTGTELTIRAVAGFRGTHSRPSEPDTRRMRTMVWSLGDTTREALLSALSAGPTETVQIIEHKGLVEIDSRVRLAVM
jgi:hypothetical protein